MDDADGGFLLGSEVNLLGSGINSVSSGLNWEGSEVNLGLMWRGVMAVLDLTEREGDICLTAST